MTNLEHLKLGGPIAEGKLGGSLPDLDTLTPEELEKLADEAREEISALSELWLIVSEATVEEKIAIAGLALIKCKEQTLIRGEFDSYVVDDHPEFMKACRFLAKVRSTEERISFAIAVLEGVQTEDDDDEDDDDEESDEEIEEAIKQNNLNRALRLAAESEAIKEEFYAGHPAY